MLAKMKIGEMSKKVMQRALFNGAKRFVGLDNLI
jgi:hypothetical protein